MKATTQLACEWLIEVASGNPEPDSYADTIRIVPCGTPTDDERGVCADHAHLLDMDDLVFEAWVEAKDDWR